MLKKMLPALCCAALAAGCASTATTGSSAEPLSGEKPAQLADRSFMWVDGASEDCELPPSIRFGADGRISGQAGCNRMLGSWKRSIWVKSPRRCVCAVQPSWKSRRNSSAFLVRPSTSRRRLTERALCFGTTRARSSLNCFRNAQASATKEKRSSIKKNAPRISILGAFFLAAGESTP